MLFCDMAWVVSETITTALYNGRGVQMYLCVKIMDIVKIVIFHFWLKKERWLNNLTTEHKQEKM